MSKKKLKRNIYIYTGEGQGKTTASLGLALRALGHGKKVVVIQFLKGRKDIGEYKIQKKLSPKFRIYQFGRKGLVNLKKPSSIDIELAKTGLAFARECLKKKPDILILDEINLAAAYGLVGKKEILKVLKKAPSKTTLVLTGRYVPKEFVRLATLVSEIKEIKHHEKCYKGLEY